MFRHPRIPGRCGRGLLGFQEKNNLYISHQLSNPKGIEKITPLNTYIGFSFSSSSHSSLSISSSNSWSFTFVINPICGSLPKPLILFLVCSATWLIKLHPFLPRITNKYTFCQCLIGYSKYFLNTYMVIGFILINKLLVILTPWKPIFVIYSLWMLGVVFRIIQDKGGALKSSSEGSIT